MRILAFNGSPRMKNGITDRILQMFLEGAKNAGADTETVYVSEKNIKYCTGCFNCWFVHPGRCIHNDDMPEIRNKIKAADLIVLASPVYLDGFTAQLKTMLDRLIAGGLPFIENRGGHSRHPSKGKEAKKRKMLLISTSGFGERDNFDPMIQHMKAIADNFATGEYMGALIRPMGGAMDLLRDEDPEKGNAIMGAFRQAGVEAVTRGAVSEELQGAVAAPLMSVSEYVNRANQLFRELIEESERKRSDKASGTP